MTRTKEELAQGYTITIEGDLMFATVTDTRLSTDEERIMRSNLMYEDTIKKYAENPYKKFSVIFDIRVMQNESNVVPSEMRKKYSAVLRHEQTKKVAVVGKTEDQTGSVKFVLFLVKALGMNNVGWFSTMEEAKIWIQQ